MKKITSEVKATDSSFRDPSGFIFFRNGLIYRQINNNYKANYEQLINSGLYKNLVEAKLLIPHAEIGLEYAKSKEAYKIIKPELISFISYPYEWCFSQLKDSALLTLKLQKIALEFGMSLKDCSAYNLQFKKGRPIFIDSLSFEKYRQGQPWIAYGQFCQHFLAPLTLMSYKDIRLNKLFCLFIDGIPLDLASLLLPLRTRFNFSLFSHIHLHTKTQHYFADKPVCKKRKDQMTRLKLLALIDNLESAVRNLRWQPQGTEWVNYYRDTNYSTNAQEHKKQLVAGYLDKIKPKVVWDFGANTGLYSRIASGKNIETVSFDIDSAAVEKNYLECVKSNETNILPLILDVTNPSPAIGWANTERLSLIERGPADTAIVLALIHHLAISNNLPFGNIASFFDKICHSLIIEFIPKRDSQVKRLLLTREDIFDDYTQGKFENEFSQYFSIVNSVKIKNSERILYLMKKVSPR